MTRSIARAKPLTLQWSVSYKPFNFPHLKHSAISQSTNARMSQAIVHQPKVAGVRILEHPSVGRWL